MKPRIQKAKNENEEDKKVKRIIISVVVFVFASCSFGQPGLSDEAKAFFDKGDYLQGMNILTKAMNAPDPVERARAQQAYGRFYENIVGNVDYALNFYNDVLRSNLPEGDPIKSAALKDASRIKVLKIQYKTEDTLLKKLRPAESIGESEKKEQIAQLLAIVKQKPDYYRLSEVYYQIGRNYFAVDDYHKAYAALQKSLKLRPGVNFYLPVNVWADMAYGKWARATIHSATLWVFAGLLSLTVIIFYASRPWRWLKFRHLAAGILMAVLWVAVFSVSYMWLTSRTASEATMFEAGVVPPYFLSFGPDGPFWVIAQKLFVYGLVGVLGLFVFSLGISRLKNRWAALAINLAFALLLFISLMTVFYMQNCDQKSIFGSGVKDGSLHYLEGSSYFVSFGMEPYVLTNPRDYPNLATSNVSDPYMLEWIKKYCPFSPSGKRE
jgi:tetratricopeptide (TPR) repeat protein